MRSALLLLALVASARSAAAQDKERSTLIAIVNDAKTGLPILGAEVVLFQLRRVARTDSIGQARLERIERGSYRVRVRQIGYSPRESEIEVRSDSVVSSSSLEPVAVELAAIRVTEPAPWYLKEFEQRRRHGIGRFLTEQELAKEGNRDLVNVALSRFPGLRVVNAQLASTRGGCGAKGSSGRSCFSMACPIQVFLDDMNLGVDFDIARTWDLAGVEYYTGASMPPRYRVDGSACGVMLLWSKRGDR